MSQMSIYPVGEYGDDSGRPFDPSTAGASVRLHAVQDLPSTGGGAIYRRGGKRLVDILVSTAGLCFVAPILLVLWLALTLRLGPGVVLRQVRVGRNGEDFSMLKFRTMRHCRRDEQLDDGFDGLDRRLTHKTTDDPRHTRLGLMIRRFSLDELPQLINIARGDMSLVGPRPELASVATAEFRAHGRHTVRPGLTGPFQVSDLRGNGDLGAGLRYDEYYVSTLGLSNDLHYLVQTFGAVQQGTGS